MNEVLAALAKAITTRSFRRAIQLQNLLRIDICARLANEANAVDPMLHRAAWLATIDPRSKAARRAIEFTPLPKG